MKDLRWPHVTVIVAVLGMLGWLSYEGKDGAGVIAGVLALLGALGYVAHQQSQIKEHTSAIKQQTNGSLSELMRQSENKDRIIKELADKLAEMQPPTAPPTDSDETS